LLRDWQRFYAKQLPPPAQHNCDLPEFWAAEKLDQLAHHEPDTAWLLILELLRQQLPDNAFANLAAGPLEDLLQYHGAVMIDRIEAEAKCDPEFRRLLGGVWRSGPPEVWARVEHVRGEVW
jgi:hypothetical protein